MTRTSIYHSINCRSISTTKTKVCLKWNSAIAGAKSSQTWLRLLCQKTRESQLIILNNNYKFNNIVCFNRIKISRMTKTSLMYHLMRERRNAAPLIITLSCNFSRNNIFVAISNCSKTPPPPSQVQTRI